MSTFSKYDTPWNDGTDPLAIELYMVRRGDAWLKQRGRSLFFHVKEAQKLLWPKDDHHRWTDLITQTICENEISTIMGCSDSTKTWTVSKFALTDYWSSPMETLWLVSTTEGRGSELRIWGAIKDLFNGARERHPWLAGNPIDYMKTITTDEIDEERFAARSLRRGLIVIPCKSGSTASGLAPYIGIKAGRLRHAGDETQVMSQSHLNAYANWFGKEDFKGINCGNFMETDDPLGVAAEPVEGWEEWNDTGKTQTWRGKFYGAAVVALDGRDSPNFDYPMPDGQRKFKYLIGQKKLDAVRLTYGEDSWQWWSQCVGKPAKGLDIWRVVTQDFCRKRKAADPVFWKGATTMLYALDPAYGGGDRCIGRRVELGNDTEGQQILFIHPPELVPVKPMGGEPEEQIALFLKNRLNELKIEPRNCFYDSFGRGTLGFALAKLFGHVCPVPVDSSASPTRRPVRFDLWITTSNGDRRLKRCDEHYTKFITELWFSVREAIDAEQIRGMDAETIREGSSRKFTRNNHNKLELETKEDYKERNHGRSPDLFDCVAIGVEGARQRGFKIKRLGDAVAKAKGRDWLEQEVEKHQRLIHSRQLQTR